LGRELPGGAFMDYQMLAVRPEVRSEPAGGQQHALPEGFQFLRPRAPKPTGDMRHALPEGFQLHSVKGISEQSHFENVLRQIPVDDRVMDELKGLGFNARQSVPTGMFHSRFSRASQVTRFESTTAYAYTDGFVFADTMSRLMLQPQEEWRTLLSEYGQVVKCLWSYCKKMQSAYGKEQRLFRGMRLPEHELHNYALGQDFFWCAFTSTSSSKQVAVDFALEGARMGGVPVVFEINTRTRGAPILGWSKHPAEDEVLLMPFQGFVVEGRRYQRFGHGSVLVVELRTMVQVTVGMELPGGVFMDSQVLEVRPEVRSEQETPLRLDPRARERARARARSSQQEAPLRLEPRSEQKSLRRLYLWLLPASIVVAFLLHKRR